MRNTARWGQDRPMEPATADKLVKAVAAVYGPASVRLAVLVLSGAVEKVVDNEDDAQETLRRLEARKK